MIHSEHVTFGNEEILLELVGEIGIVGLDDDNDNTDGSIDIIGEDDIPQESKSEYDMQEKPKTPGQQQWFQSKTNPVGERTLEIEPFRPEATERLVANGHRKLIPHSHRGRARPFLHGRTWEKAQLLVPFDRLREHNIGDKQSARENG